MSKVIKTVKTKVVKAKELNVAEPVVVEPVVVEPVVESVAEPVVESVVEPECDMKHKFEALIESKQSLLNTITAALKKDIQELRKLQKDHDNLMKDALKKQKKKKAPKDENAIPRKPSGFHAPVVVSDEMYKFLEQFGVKQGDPIARTEITRHLTKYIKQNDLQHPQHRREIIPDATLLKLINNAPPAGLRDLKDPNSEKVYSFLGFQRYLSSHFPKKVVKV